jgi:succinate-semialdehyde dehydrogenase/glutarate-semialdehyde dehydrogenase/succinate-semialdehyde dehydrogenase
MTFVSCNPATGAVFFTRPAWTPAQLDHHLDALRAAQLHWRRQSVAVRCATLLALSQQLLAHRDELARLISSEVGKLIGECQAEVEKSAKLCHYYAELAPQLLAAQEIPTLASRSGVSFEPLGLVLAVMPWNYPVWQVLRFAVPALAAGNGCLVKPAPSVPQTSQRLLELVREAGIDALDMAWIDTPLVEHAIIRCDAVAFTGSTRTGSRIAELAGRHIKKSVLELGGSNPCIVLADADIALAAEEAAHSRFRDAGQSCNAAKRMIVVPDIAEAFLQAFLAAARRQQPGNPLDPDTTLAPLARADLRTALHEQVCDAVAHGARCLLGGELPDGPGFFYPATVLDQVTPACRVWREETFGPVATVLRAQSDADAIRLANDTPFGLGASLYSADLDRAQALAAELEVGSVFINRHTSSDLRLPFGGVKASGYGRELSEFGLYEFVNVKTYWQR